MNLYKKMKIRLWDNIKTTTHFLWTLFDIRDCFIFGGLGLIGYGLWLFLPWVACVVCGALLMLLGLGFLTRGQP